MSQIHDGPLATYSSLTDRNLAGYFANTRMRRHLRKAGLVNKRGQIVSENQYRLNMARKEHKKHVKDLLAQAIVHKTLDIERNRQVEIKRKLEEISKLELVRRVRAQKFRKGDEDILPYLSPRSSRPASRYRPRSAPADRQYNDSYEADVIYVDDEGRPVTPPKEIDEEVGGKREEIDTRHLYALDSAALKKYALTLSKIEQGEGLSSPYLISQAPSPPQSARASTRNTYRDARYKPRLHRPRTANSLSPYRSQRTGAVQGTLMLHRQEPAMMHQGEVQTLCEVTMKYYGPNLILPRDQRDPTQDVEIEQQHCGGNTLPVFKERIKPGDEFTFISRRHRGYPFSLSIFVDGRISARVSTCCEYGHAKGVRLGGKMGQFCLKSITGATPCYKCKLNAQASPRTLKRPPTKKKQEVEEIKEEIIVLRPEKKKQEEEDKYDDDFEDDDSKKDSGTEKYNDDFESEDDERSKTPQPSKRTRSRSSSSSSSSSSSRSRSRTPTPRKDPDDNRKIYGLRADEDVKKGGSDSERSDLPVKVLGHSDEDEQPESKKWTERQVKEKKQRRSSYSSTSSSSSTRSRDSIKQKNKEVKKSQVIETTTDETKTESTTSDAHVSVDTEPKQRSVRRKSSSSSSSSSDSEDNVKKYSEKLEEDERRREEEQRLEVRREEERRRQEEQRKADIRREEEMRQEEEKRKREEEKRRLEEEQRRVDVRMEEQRRKEEEKRKRDEEFRKSSHEQKREEEQRRWAEEESKRRVEERRKREHEEVQRREAYAKRKETAHISSTPDMDYVPEPVSYSRIYEEERVEALKSIKQGQTRYAKSSSSSSSSSESERDEPYKKSSATEKKMSPTQSPAKVTPPRSVATSSSSRESETDTDADKKAKNTVSAAHRVPSPIKGSSSSSSSSSDSDTDTGKVKKQLTPPRTPSPAKVTPPRSAVDSSSSSSSDSETETDTDRRVTSSTVKTSPVKVEPKVIKEERESSSSSSSDSETETDNEKIPKKVNTPPQPLVPIVETKRRDESSSSDTETETDNEKVKKETEQQKERLSSIKENVVKSSGTSGSSSTSSSSSDSETDTERTKTAETLPSVQEEKKKEVTAEVKKDLCLILMTSEGIVVVKTKFSPKFHKN